MINLVLATRLEVPQSLHGPYVLIPRWLFHAVNPATKVKESSSWQHFSLESFVDFCTRNCCIGVEWTNVYADIWYYPAIRCRHWMSHEMGMPWCSIFVPRAAFRSVNSVPGRPFFAEERHRKRTGDRVIASLAGCLFWKGQMMVVECCGFDWLQVLSFIPRKCDDDWDGWFLNFRLGMSGFSVQGGAPKLSLFLNSFIKRYMYPLTIEFPSM